MTRLTGPLLASVLAFSPALALADANDAKPLSKMEAQEAKAAREAAQAKWDKMTPEQQAATRKAARNKKLSEATALYESRQPFTHPDGTPLVGDFGSPAPLPPAGRPQ